MGIRGCFPSRRRTHWGKLPLVMAMMGCPFQPSFAQGSATAGRRQSGRLRGEQGRDLIYKFVEKRPKIPDFRGSKLIHESTMAEALSYGYLHVDGIGTEQFDYCYNALEGVAVDGKVCFPQYKEFLYELSNGQVSEDDPPEVFVLIFHSTACSNGQDCAHNDPYISLDQEGVNLWVLRVLCEEVLSHLVTETTVSFEFSLRYDPDLLDAPTLAECISNATENLLYDHFGCSNNDDPSRQRELQGLKAEAKSTVSGVGGGSGQAGTPETMEDTREMALIQEVFSSNAGHWDRDTCPYSVMTEVIILDIACIPTLVPTNATACGLVQSSVTVQVPQLYQPLEDALYGDVASTLRTSINTGTFQQYFPADCHL